MAAESGSVECVRLILEHGADPNTLDDLGETALMRAGRAKVFAALLEAGADPHICAEYGGDALNKFRGFRNLCGPSSVASTAASSRHRHSPLPASTATERHDGRLVGAPDCAPAPEQMRRAACTARLLNVLCDIDPHTTVDASGARLPPTRPSWLASRALVALCFFGNSFEIVSLSPMSNPHKRPCTDFAKNGP